MNEFWTKYKTAILSLGLVLILILGGFSIKGCVDEYNSRKGIAERIEEQRKVDQIEQQLQSVKENEKYKYPKIDKNIADTEAANKEVKKKLSNIKDTSKEDIRNEFKNYSSNDIVRAFNELGYSCVLIRR